MRFVVPIFWLAAAPALTPALAEDAADGAALELETIVVTAPAGDEPKLPAVPVTTITDDELRLKAGRSIGDTLKNELGVHSQSFGPGVGTPVVRGQAGPRVRVLSDGIGSNDASAVSPDHATGIEPLLAEHIDVLRGPAALLYGGGAIGGAVNVIDGRIPSLMPERLLGGALEQRFDSTADETATVFKAEGGKNHLAYHIDGFYRHRGNLSIGGRAIDTAAVAVTDPGLTVVDNPDGFLNNTGAEALSGSAGFSWIGASGFAGAALNHLENNYGIAPDGGGAEATVIRLRQSKYDFKGELKKPFVFAESLKTKLGYTDYQHTEVSNGEPGAFFTNQSYEGRAELIHKRAGPWSGMVGFQAQSGEFNGYEKLTGDLIVPRSDTGSYGVFALESFKWKPVEYQFGLRVEHVGIRADGFGARSFTPVGASASASWKIDARHALKLGFTRSARAPNVQELFADGFHDATRSFEIGNTGLTEETSYNLDLGYRFRVRRVRAEFDLFHNWAGHYIAQQRSGEFVDEEGRPCIIDCAPVLRTLQKNAVFKGYEARLIMPLFDSRRGSIDLTLFSDYTRGRFADGGDVPRMPPLRYGLQVDFSQNDFSAFLRLTHAEAQRHAGDFETPTGGYSLFDAGIEYKTAAARKGELLLFAKGINLLDETVRNSTSYLRNFAPEAGRGAQIGFRLSY